MPDRATAVLVRRILRIYDPWYALGVKRRVLAAALRCHKVRAAAYTGWRRPDARGDSYHAPRVLGFVFRLRDGERLDPITLDNNFDRWNSLAGLAVIDGHHRLIAAAVTQETWINCTYSGRVDLLEWLKGNRRLRPPELR